MAEDGAALTKNEIVNYFKECASKRKINKTCWMFSEGPFNHEFRVCWIGRGGPGKLSCLIFRPYGARLFFVGLLEELSLSKTANRLLLRPRRCSWAEFKVVLKIKFITVEWSFWEHSTRLIYLSFGSTLLKTKPKLQTLHLWNPEFFTKMQRKKALHLKDITQS